MVKLKVRQAAGRDDAWQSARRGAAGSFLSSRPSSRDPHRQFCLPKMAHLELFSCFSSAHLSQAHPSSAPRPREAKRAEVFGGQQVRRAAGRCWLPAAGVLSSQLHLIDHRHVKDVLRLVPAPSCARRSAGGRGLSSRTCPQWCARVGEGATLGPCRATQGAYQGTHTGL